MAGPWEQYQQQESAPGPWAAYQGGRQQQDFSFNPERDMSTFDRLAAGTGKAVVDTARGIGQFLGVSDRAQVAEARRIDAPLMNTTAGKVGNFVGNAALLAPTALIPGAATVPGAALIGGVAGLAQPSVSTGETLLNAGLGVGGGALGQAVANKIMPLLAARGQGKLQQGVQQNAQEAQRFAAAKSGADLGYVVPPADLQPGMLTEAMSGLSGKIKTAQVASQRNQAVTDRLAKQSLGIAPDEPLTIDALNAIRQKVGQAYQAVETTGTITPGPSYSAALDKIAAPHVKAAQGFPNAKPNPVLAEIESLRSNQFDASSAVAKIRALRADADTAYAGGNKDLGRALKDGAAALEGAIDDHLVQIGAPRDLLQGYRDARQTIAKTYTVQKALNNETGSVSAPRLAADLTKGRPLSGDLLDIARMGQAFPKATQALKEAPKAVSPLDFLGAGIGAGATGSPLAMASVAARPAVRNLLLSAPYQRAALRQSTPSAGLLGLAEIDMLRRLAAPVGVAGGVALADR